MTLIRCPKHGTSGFRETCQHVDAEFKSGNYREFRRLNFWGNLMVCDNCWNEYNFVRFESHPEIAGQDYWDVEEETPIVQEYYNAYHKLSRRAWCLNCISELREKAKFS